MRFFSQKHLVKAPDHTRCSHKKCLRTNAHVLEVPWYMYSLQKTPLVTLSKTQPQDDSASATRGYIACPYCDLVYPVQALKAGQVARCRRCQTNLYQGGNMSLDTSLAWAVTALVLWILSNAFPILSIKMAGRESAATFWQAVIGFAGEGRWLLAFVVLLTSMLVPLFRIASLLWLLGLARFNRLRPGVSARLLRWNLAAAPWGMMEIYLLALLVAMVKLRDLATVVPGFAFFSFFGLVFSLAVLAVLTNFHQLWAMLEPS